ncbi:MAG: hypothetical protein AAGD25_22850 [Cyanobacteria bacterium P01_F01_bin.150]
MIKVSLIKVLPIVLSPIALTSTIVLTAVVPVAIAHPELSIPDVSNPDLSTAAEFSSYSFTVEVTDGPLAGRQFDGSFCYPKDSINGEGIEVLREADGFSVSMNFFGDVYTAADDTSYPDFPRLTLEDGEVMQLDFWIEEVKREVWWDFPHWDVSLSSPDDTADCAIAPNTSTNEPRTESR